MGMLIQIKTIFQTEFTPFFYEENQTNPEPHQWGSLAAWAWGMSRVMDYFETENFGL